MENRHFGKYFKYKFRFFFKIFKVGAVKIFNWQFIRFYYYWLIINIIYFLSFDEGRIIENHFGKTFKVKFRFFFRIFIVGAVKIFNWQFIRFCIGDYYWLIINIIYFLSFDKERMGKNNGKSFWKDF